MDGPGWRWQGRRGKNRAWVPGFIYQPGDWRYPTFSWTAFGEKKLTGHEGGGGSRRQGRQRSIVFGVRIHGRCHSTGTVRVAFTQMCIPANVTFSPNTNFFDVEPESTAISISHDPVQRIQIFLSIASTRRREFTNLSSETLTSLFRDSLEILAK